MPPQMPNTSGAGRACRLAVVLTVRKGSCIIMIRVIEIFLKKLACSVPVFVGASSVAALAVTRSSELTWIRQVMVNWLPVLLLLRVTSPLMTL